MSQQCFMCDAEGEDKVKFAEWTLEGLEWMYGDGGKKDFGSMKLCDKHRAFCKDRIAVLRGENPNLPPKPTTPEEAVKYGDMMEREGRPTGLWVRDAGEEG